MTDCEYCARPECGIFIKGQHCCLLRWLADEPRAMCQAYLRRVAETDGPAAAEKLKQEVMPLREAKARRRIGDLFEQPEKVEA